MTKEHALILLGVSAAILWFRTPTGQLPVLGMFLSSGPVHQTQLTYVDWLAMGGLVFATYTLVK